MRVADLARELGVSDMTVRRDLEILHNRGLIEKVHGGATVIARQRALRARVRREVEPPGDREGGDRRRGRRPGRAGHGDRDLGRHDDLRAGPAPRRRGRPHGRHELACRSPTSSIGPAGADQTIILTGGVRTPSDALVGPFAVAALRTIHLDQVFIGVHGMDPRSGFTTPERPRGGHGPGARRRRPPARRRRRLEQVGRDRDQLDRPARRGRHARHRCRVWTRRPARSPPNRSASSLIAAVARPGVRR